MPRLGDHDQRRRQIAEAVWRIASTRGLEDVSLRKVATEAGVSLRLVQYYFGTRDDLLLGSLEILNQETCKHVPQDTTPREILRTLLLGLLPLDDDSRMRYLVHLAYFVRSLSDPVLAAAFGARTPELERLTAGLLARGQDGGAVHEDFDPVPEAELLITIVDGLRTSIITGRRSAEDAGALIDHQLNRLFSRANVAI